MFLQVSFSFLKPIYPISIRLPNHNFVTAKFSGTIKLGNLVLHNTLFVPDFSVHLVSISKLLSSNNCFIIFHQNNCLIVQMDTYQTIGVAKKYQGLFYLHSSSNNRASDSESNHLPSVFNNTSDSCNLWHMKLGHPSNKVFQTLATQYPDISFQFLDACDACAFAKQKRLQFSASKTKSSCFFHLIHVDIWGPISTTSIDGYKYFLTIVDDYSCFTWVLLLKHKTYVKTSLQNFIILIENQFSCTLKILRSDNGKEFSLNEFYATKGIFHETTCVATPQQNGIVERKHQHILNVCRSLLFQSKVLNVFWSYSIKLVVHIINRLPTPFLQNISPYEKIHSIKPDFANLKVFGCLSYSSSPTA